MTLPERQLGPIHRSFFTVGWLLIAALPLAQILGRSVFTVFGVLYLVWGLSAIVLARPSFDAGVARLYVLLLASFAASCAFANDKSIAFHQWQNFLLFSIVAFPASAALRSTDDYGRMVSAFALFGAFAIVWLYLRLSVQIQDPAFRPQYDMREDNLPFILPFILCAITIHCAPRFRIPVAVISVLAVFGYVVAASGRAALVGATAALITYLGLNSAIRKRTIVAISTGIIALAILASGEKIFRHASTQTTLESALNRASSFRLELWQRAVTTLPENLLLGAGMGNTPVELLKVNQSSTVNVGHLHNFVLDLWHETGLLGLFAMTLWLTTLVSRGIRNRQAAEPQMRLYLGTLLAAEAAIISSALFSFSYGSKQFACYLFVFLVAQTPPEPGRFRSPTA